MVPVEAILCTALLPSRVAGAFAASFAADRLPSSDRLVSCQPLVSGSESAFHHAPVANRRHSFRALRSVPAACVLLLSAGRAKATAGTEATPLAKHGSGGESRATVVLNG